MGGEKLYEQMEQGAGRGSPPHGRGKGRKRSRPSPAQRITPAWAGKRDQRLEGSSPDEDHPRMGGEKQRPPNCACFRMGSPPHGRGKDKKLIETEPIDRITPAWAGKSICYSHWCFSCKDHPRMGGEKRCLGLLLTLQCGSPPHGRGKVFVHQVSPLDVGITPAWAGKRVLSSNCWFFAQDHPRMGGEKFCCCTISASGVGSPPHGRGKVPAVSICPTRTRITPAWAGKSNQAGLEKIVYMDHPRMGGEKGG